MSLISKIFGNKSNADASLFDDKALKDIEDVANKMASEMPDFSNEELKFTNAYLMARLACVEQLLQITISELKRKK